MHPIVDPEHPMSVKRTRRRPHGRVLALPCTRNSRTTSSSRSRLRCGPPTRHRTPTGISSGTWWLVLGELTCWAIFGTYQRDVPLIVLGISGILAAALMLYRAHTATRSPAVRTMARSDEFR